MQLGWRGRPGRRPGRYQGGHGADADLALLGRERRVVRRPDLAVIPRTQPAATSRPMSSTPPSRPPRGNPPDLGHVEVSGREAGVGGHDAREPVGVLGHQPQPEQPAPVLSDEGDVAQVEVVHDQPRAHSTWRAKVWSPCERLVRPPEPDHVGRHAPDAGLGEDPDHVPVQERPRRLAVQQQRDRPSAGRRRRTPSGACRRRRPAPRRTTPARGSPTGRRSTRPACDRSPCRQSGDPRMNGARTCPIGGPGWKSHASSSARRASSRGY